MLDSVRFRRTLHRAEITRFSHKLADLEMQIASLEEQIDVLVGYLQDHQSRLSANERLKDQIDTLVSYARDHQSRLIAHEHRFEIAESRIDLLDKVLGPIVKSVRLLRRRWRMLFGPR